MLTVNPTMLIIMLFHNIGGGRRFTMMMMTTMMTISKMIAIVMIMMAIVATMTTVITTYYGDAIHGLLAWLAGLPANQDAITRMAGRPAGLLAGWPAGRPGAVRGTCHAAPHIGHALGSEETGSRDDSSSRDYLGRRQNATNHNGNCAIHLIGCSRPRSSYYV